MKLTIQRHEFLFSVLVLGLVGLVLYAGTRYARYDFRHDLPGDLEERIVMAKRGTRIVTTIPARPGNVYGRGWKVPIMMASSWQVPSCYIDPSLLKKKVGTGNNAKLVPDKRQLCELLVDLSGVLNLNVGDLAASLVAQRGSFARAQRQHYEITLAKWQANPTGPKPTKKTTELQFFWVKHEMSRQEREALVAWKIAASKKAKAASVKMASGEGLAYRKHARQKTRAVGVQYEWRRTYPNGSCGATVLGYFNRNNEPGGGIHSTLARLLLPREGRLVLRGDVHRRPFAVELNESEMPEDGCNVYLSIDMNIQHYLQTAVAAACEKYQAEWGTGVVINPWTGDVLAMCSVPNFDPNQFNTTDPANMLNRAICMPYEPGSIFKPMIAASAVQLGVVNWETKIDTGNGTYHAPRGGTISDHGSRYGVISVRTGIIKSSNVLMAKIGGMLGNRDLHRLLGTWGFGRKTNIHLPGESGGIVRPLAKWDGYSTPRVPIGQEVATTALQVALAYGAIANGGILMQPRLVQKVVDSSGRLLREVPAQPVRKVLSKAVANQTLGVLEEVVQRGTGKNCKIPGYRVFGKTGTAQIAGVGGYEGHGYCASFVGGAPAGKPALICLISIYKPDRSIGYYGGTVAAPAVRDVLEKSLRYLQIPSEEESSSSESLHSNGAHDANAGIRAEQERSREPIPSVGPGSESTWGAITPDSEIDPFSSGLYDILYPYRPQTVWIA
jgi:cell division protein FtsI/penicillin-binding protein 2